MFVGKYDITKRNSKILPPIMDGISTAQLSYEFSELVGVYCKLKPKYVVEIGTWHGGTLWHWLKNAEQGAHVVSIDMGPTYWVPAEPDFDMTQWKSWVVPGTFLHTIVADSRSQETMDKVKSICPHIDFLFIDADHSYEGARIDFENYGPLVRSGGIIVFHDLIPPPDRPRIQVGKLFREIQRAGYITRELYSSPTQNRMGIGIVYKE